MKTDYKKEYKQLYKYGKMTPSLVEVPALNYVMIDGVGDPNTSQDYMEAIEALYAVSYTLKFMSKKKEMDYVVMPLEGLWWMEEEWDMDAKDDWQWTAMIMQPPCIDESMFKEAVEITRGKKVLPALDKIRFETYKAHMAFQILHKGPYADEGPVIERLHQHMEFEGYTFAGKHHEIYLSDPRKTAPEKLKTIIRQPAKKKG